MTVASRMRARETFAGTDVWREKKKGEREMLNERRGRRRLRKRERCLKVSEMQIRKVEEQDRGKGGREEVRYASNEINIRKVKASLRAGKSN